MTAGYLMGNYRFRSLNLLGGIRYELTESEGTGPVIDNEAARDAAANQLLAYVQGYGFATVNDAYRAAISSTATLPP